MRKDILRNGLLVGAIAFGGLKVASEVRQAVNHCQLKDLRFEQINAGTGFYANTIIDCGEKELFAHTSMSLLHGGNITEIGVDGPRSRNSLNFNYSFGNPSSYTGAQTFYSKIDKRTNEAGFIGLDFYIDEDTGQKSLSLLELDIKRVTGKRIVADRKVRNK